MTRTYTYSIVNNKIIHVRKGKIMTVGYIGDTHGSLSNLDYAITWCFQHAVSTLVHVGDFWTYQGKATVDKLERLIITRSKQFNIENPLLLFIDGNHEFFPLLDINANTLQEISPHVKYIPRGMYFEIDNTVFGFLGGATSIDAQYRTNGTDWFPEESITYTQAQKLVHKVDVLVTHDSSTEVFEDIKKKHFPDSNNTCGASDRAYIDMVIYQTQPKYHIHGHHHISQVYTSSQEDFITISLSSDGNTGCAAIIREDSTIVLSPGKYHKKEGDVIISHHLHEKL